MPAMATATMTMATATTMAMATATISGEGCEIKTVFVRFVRDSCLGVLRVPTDEGELHVRMTTACSLVKSVTRIFRLKHLSIHAHKNNFSNFNFNYFQF